MKTKLNIGGGPKRLDGYTNVDGLDWNGRTDVLCDFTKEKLPFEDSSVEHVVCEEVLEHLPFRESLKLLKEIYRVLDFDKELYIQVPDCGKAMEYYVNKQVCSCVPHKALSYEDFVADPTCKKCKGKAKINDTRWLFSFTGAQKHRFDAHLNIFTEEVLSSLLKQAGFEKITKVDNIYKLIFNARK